MRPAATLPIPHRRRLTGRTTMLIGIALAIMIAAVGSARAGWVELPGQLGALVPAPPRLVAYTFLDAGVAKLDAASGAVLARWPLPSAVPHPAFTVAPDGAYVYVLNIDIDASRPESPMAPHLYVLDGDTLTPQVSVPAPGYARAIGWSPIVALPDNRTVAVFQTDSSLIYFDRQLGTFAADRTPLPACGGGDIVPLSALQLAVRCDDTNDVRVIDLASRKVIAAVSLGQPYGPSRPGHAIAATQVPGTTKLAVILNDARLLHVDVVKQTITPIAELAPGAGDVVPSEGVGFNVYGRAVVGLSASQGDRTTGKVSTLLVVDVATGQILRRLAQPSHTGVNIAPDGRLFVSDGAQRTSLDPVTGRKQPMSFGYPVVFRQGGDGR